jgi:hypothetical protein
VNRDDIIRMAREAELHCHVKLTEHGLIIEDLQYFANLVAAAEREACANACEAKGMVKGGEVFAARIRARGEK